VQGLAVTSATKRHPLDQHLPAHLAGHAVEVVSRHEPLSHREARPPAHGSARVAESVDGARPGHGAPLLPRFAGASTRPFFTRLNSRSSARKARTMKGTRSAGAAG